ncbi:B12-binding domain-containing radical SAM protein [Hydrococcus rivularis NIES-593]|uniref:B12-binding domain-containing radical SAM protein n=1 Tax=Hydrococcus rivularis NIES-593 TaxID=1921803 RepID=A0A1U7HPV8_9CYAN|nr:B12-binding domain-containing radical SAM protein [Hydrococcus rivularis]OKH25622.1 B12-binding domain-containing radical SAM protein [Hydrococcus rivularis NIES-593]
MRVLLLYPLFPQSFWSFEKTLALVNRKALLPPLGLITVAAILPQAWEYKLVDRNVREATEQDWDWAELVIVSGMIVQKEDMLAQIQEAKRRGKRVVAGGPYPTSLPDEVKAAGADYLVLDEGEITLPLLVEAIARGEANGTFRATEKPSVTETPIPRYDLLEFDAYDNMSLQFSRGCPFQCEFCDIIVLYGRKSRTKTPAQLLAELDRLYDLGWRGSVFMVDDNFIGNKRNVKLLLKELKVWMAQKKYPFKFLTEASVDLADDPELMELMAECNFTNVFLGIETPDEDSLNLTKKFQNTRNSLSEAIEKITRSGLRVMAGFIIGFDGEKPGAGDRIVRFVEQTDIPVAMFSMLQALPNTALWHRLEKEGRLLAEKSGMNQTTLMNFVPTRPIEDIAREYIEGFWQLYDPERYLDRTFRHFMKLRAPKHSGEFRLRLREIRALLILIWRQGMLRKTRWKFWINLFKILRYNPRVTDHYIKVCAFIEHFYDYRQIVRDQINAQLATHLATHSPIVTKLGGADRPDWQEKTAV